jgi:hypothetical protein
MSELKSKRQLQALVIYFSATGNTKKVADEICEALGEDQVAVTLRSVKDAAGEDLYSYDIVFLGSPSFSFLPAEPVLRFVKEKMAYHRDRGDIKPCAPEIPGKTAVVFVTYSGPHTGINEAIPVGKYLGQFFEHLGFKVSGEWYVVGEFHNNLEHSTKGRLGDVRGRPNRQDLDKVRLNVKEMMREISLEEKYSK